MDPQPDPKSLELWTAAQVARRLNVSERTVRRLAKDPESGFPEPSWLGGSARWFPADVERYVLDLYRGKAGKKRRPRPPAGGKT